MKKVKNKKAGLNENQWGGIPLSTELFQKYGNINSIKNAVAINLNGNIGNAKHELQEMIKRAQKEKDSTIKHIKNFFGPALIDISYKLLYNLIPNEYFDEQNEYLYVRFENYTNYLLNLRNDFEKKLIDLSILVSIENIKNKEICIMNCYTEVKSTIRKLLYAIACSENDLESMKNTVEYEDVPEYLSLISYAESDMDLKKIYNFYKDIYNNICEIGDYLFVYLDKYEEICNLEQNEFKKVLLAQEKIRNELKQNSNK